jgi:hypothetical protein
MAESPLDTALVRREERGFAATAHLFAAIPLWGLVFLAVLLVWFKERSREVVFHIIQAMVFQGLLLVPVLGWVVIELLGRMVEVLSPTISEGVHLINAGLLFLVYTLYVVVCLYGCAATYAGRPFLYPFVGKPVLEGTRRKFSEGGQP